MIHITTHDHLGDAAILTGAVRNVLAAHPGVEIRYSGAGEKLFASLPVAVGNDGSPRTKITYGKWEDEQIAGNGNLVEGFARDLCYKIGIPMVPLATRVPWISAEPDRRYAGKIILNANCQRGTMTKRYPYWQQVVDEVRSFAEVIQIGGCEDRDISPDLSGVTDMRGMTGDLSVLLAMVAGAACVLCPPTSLLNIAAGLGRPGVCVLGAREAEMLSAYPGIEYVSQPSCGYDGVYSGCICLTHDSYSRRGCRNVSCIGGSFYSKCMRDLHPLRVAAAVRRILADEKNKNGEKK